MAFPTQECKRCGTAVIVAALRTGRTVTVDVETGTGGTVRLTDRGGLQPLAEMPKAAQRFGAKLRRPHIDTCARRTGTSRSE